MRRLVVFDIDGTLTDTNEVDDACYVRAVATVLGLEAAALDWSAAPHGIRASSLYSSGLGRQAAPCACAAVGAMARRAHSALPKAAHPPRRPVAVAIIRNRLDVDQTERVQRIVPTTSLRLENSRDGTTRSSRAPSGPRRRFQVRLPPAELVHHAVHGVPMPADAVPPVGSARAMVNFDAGLPRGKVEPCRVRVSPL
ncbi:MAG TPA: hypothetical protein VMM18_16525 [Gemmatimonadaceae bacterium]|nr:hypothetical protein [Gemmatimonadaceae bacterium]